jgi:sugar lactone lactonase YvrE
MAKIVQFGSVIAELGEGPMWSPGEGAFYWIDVTQRRFYRQTAERGEAEVWQFEKMPGSYGFRRGGGFIFAFRNALALGDGPTGPFTPIGTPMIDFKVERFNDGKVDRRGRFWVGSFDPTFRDGGGSLYRVDTDLKVTRMDQGVSMSNGIGWSPDNRTMYFADSRPGSIWCYDFDLESGEIGDRRTFLDYAGRPGRPDGLTVDAEGFIWVAEVTAQRIARYDPKARLERAIEVPVSRPTSVMFGGADMRTLLITSMRLGMSAEEQAKEPLAGANFVFQADVQGVVEPMFGR